MERPGRPGARAAAGGGQARQGGITSLSYSAESESASEARGPRLALLSSTDGGQGGILMIFWWQLMANYGEFQVDLFGDYLHRHALQVEKVR